MRNRLAGFAVCGVSGTAGLAMTTAGVLMSVRMCFPFACDTAPADPLGLPIMVTGILLTVAAPLAGSRVSGRERWIRWGFAGLAASLASGILYSAVADDLLAIMGVSLAVGTAVAVRPDGPASMWGRAAALGAVAILGAILPTGAVSAGLALLAVPGVAIVETITARERHRPDGLGSHRPDPLP